MLSTLERKLSLGLALNALETNNDLLGSLSFLVENRLSLTTISLLLTVVSSLTLGVFGGLACLVLGHLVLGVAAALLAFAIGAAGLRNVDHCR